jgi:hypothetical protein
MMEFSIDHSTIVFRQTRRGINATATIMVNGTEPVGQIHDVAEKIVADVTFATTTARAAFVTEARQARPIIFEKMDHDDSIFISEYARALLAAAEQRMLSEISSES